MKVLIQYQSQNVAGGHYVDADKVFGLVLGKLADCDVWFHCGESVTFAGILTRRNGVSRWL